MGGVPCCCTISSSLGGLRVSVSGGTGQLLSSVPCGSNGQLVYGCSVYEEPSRDAGGLLESKGEEMGTAGEAHTPPDALPAC